METDIYIIGKDMGIMDRKFANNKDINNMDTNIKNTNVEDICVKTTKDENTNYTYILRCSDDSLYTGWTNNLEKRLAAHNEGRGAKYTKCRRPVELVYSESFPTKEEAMRREWEIKQLSRKAKLELISN